MRHKFKAVKTECDGSKFPSKKEARRYNELKLLKQNGDIVFFLRQVPFHLPGNIKYVCDFMIFWADDSVTIEDVKGFKTKDYIVKKKLVEVTYPIKIQEI
jgi:uncharacterized protein DUF1064